MPDNMSPLERKIALTITTAVFTIGGAFVTYKNIPDRHSIVLMEGNSVKIPARYELVEVDHFNVNGTRVGVYALEDEADYEWSALKAHLRGMKRGDNQTQDRMRAWEENIGNELQELEDGRLGYIARRYH